MDTSRYYTNHGVITKRSWASEEIVQVAKQLMERCQNEYESSPSSFAAASSPKASSSVLSLGSLYCGGLGPCVYLRLKLANVIKSRDPNEAKNLQEKALEMAEKSIRYEEEKKATGHGHRHNHFRVTLLEGPWIGAKVLTCALLTELQRVNDARNVANEVLASLDKACRQDLLTSECEVLYGRAGAIQAILFMRKYFDDSNFGSELVTSLGLTIFQEGRTTAKEKYNDFLPLIWEWHGKAYLGAAHGIVGILQTLLCLSTDELSTIEGTLKEDVRKLLRLTLDGLDRLCYPSGNLRSSLGTRGGDRLVHWCHGATGYVMLLTKASDFYSDSKYLERAKQIAEKVIWSRGLLRKGVGLCHGISGNGYAFLSIGRQTNNESTQKCIPSWTGKAQHFAQFGLDHFQELESVPDTPHSLFEGASGLACLLLDLVKPSEAGFPFYEFI